MKKTTDIKQREGEDQLATKKELKSTENYLDYKIETARKESEQFIKEFHDFKDSVLKSLDWLVGAFKKFDEEHTVASEQFTRLDDKVGNHEKRIMTLEQQINPSN